MFGKLYKSHFPYRFIPLEEFSTRKALLVVQKRQDKKENNRCSQISITLLDEIYR